MTPDLFTTLTSAPSAPIPLSASEAFKRAIKPVPPLIVDGYQVFRCAMCREDAHFGFRRDTQRDQAGIWFCGTHKDLGL